MSSRRDEPNVTIGRQGWTREPTAQMLGAGTSNAAGFSEIGLSANPAAMQHGLKVTAPLAARDTSQQQQIVSLQAPQSKGPGSISGSTGTASMQQQQLQPAKVATSTATAVSTAPIHVLQHQLVPPVPTSTVTTTRTITSTPVVRSMQRSVSTAIEQQRQRMAPTVHRKQQEESAAQQQGDTATNDSNSGSGSGGGETGSEPVPVGTPIMVQPGATQKSWVSLALDHLKALLLGSPPDPLSMGPPWTKWPDFARTNNINGIITGLWPSVAQAIKEDFVMTMVPQMIADAAKTYGAGILTGLELLEFELGKVPPRLDGIKVYDEVGDEQVLLELALAWGSDIKVSIGATFKLWGYTLKLPLTVQKMQLHTRVRAAAQPLIDHYPYIGSLGISLVEPPHFEVELPLPAALGGVDLLALPGIHGLFRLAVRLASRQFAVYPKGVAVPLVEGGAAAGGPKGMLQVHLVRVAGLRSEDLIGHSDPYVILRLRQGRVLRTRTINNNNNPEYNETFTMLVDDTDTQVLQLIVMDEDVIGGGKVMGVTSVPLKQCAALAVPRTKVPLTLKLNKLMAPSQGIFNILQLPVKVAGVPLAAANQGGRKVYEGLSSALGVGGGKGRTTGVGNMSPVLDETGWLGPSEEYLDEVGKTAWKDDDNQQQQQQQQQRQAAMRDSSSSFTAGLTKTGAGHDAAPMGPDGHSSGHSMTQSEGAVHVQPVSPTGSTSSFRSAFSHGTSSGVSSAAASTSASRSSSPSRTAAVRTTGDKGIYSSSSSSSSAIRPGSTAVVEPSASAISAARAAAVAAVASSSTSQSPSVTTGVTHRERRTSDSGTSHHDVISSSSSSRDQFGSGSGRTQGASGLNRLDSRSAPMPASLTVTLPSGTQLQPAAESALPAAGGTAALPPQSPRSDDGSVVSSTAGQQYSVPKSPGSTTGSTTSSSTRVRITKVLHRLSWRGNHSHDDDTAPHPDDADAPPEEVIEHQRKAAAQEAGGQAELREAQRDVTPGESGKNLTGDQLKNIYRGTVFLELTYTPFMKPGGAPTGAGASPASTSSSISAANSNATMPHDKGILAVKLVRARGLGGWQGEADPYVTLTLTEDSGAVGSGAGGTNRRQQEMRSSTIYNEDSPRWNESFDFIDVRADSILLATVWDQVTIIDAVTSLKLSRDRFKDQVLGRIKVPVLDVANSGRIKKMWPLQGALMGQLEMVLQWIPMQQVTT